MATVHIRRRTLASPDAARLIAALNAELATTFPEPGATHFSLGDTQVVAGDGAFLVAYLDDVAVSCGAVRRPARRPPKSSGCMWTRPSAAEASGALVEALEREARLVGVTTIVPAEMAAWLLDATMEGTGRETYASTTLPERRRVSLDLGPIGAGKG